MKEDWLDAFAPGVFFIQYNISSWARCLDIDLETKGRLFTGIEVIDKRRGAHNDYNRLSVNMPKGFETAAAVKMDKFNRINSILRP